MARKSACAKTSRARQVLFNLLRALYREHPVKIDIAGTVDSIAQITPELLYSCYRTFYNLNNMALVVAGSATAEQVLAVADRLLPASGRRRTGQTGAAGGAGAGSTAVYRADDAGGLAAVLSGI